MGNIPGVKWAGSTEWHQAVRPGIVAPFDRDRTDRANHVRNHNLDDTLGRALRADAERIGNGIESGGSTRNVKLHAPAQQSVAAEPAQQQVGIGHRRQGAPEAVTGRSRIGTHALGADLQQPIPVEPGYRTAPGTNGFDIDHGHPDRKAANFTREHGRHLGLADQGDISAGAPHVQCDGIGAPGRGGDMGGADDTGCRSGQRRTHRNSPGPVDRHQAPAGLIKPECCIGCGLAETVVQVRHVACHHGLQVCVEDRCREPFELPELGLHIRGS